MTIARAQLVDVSLARWYHCVTRCVRRAFLLREGDLNRKDQAWIENRLEELADIFAIGVGGFSVMDNYRFEPGGRPSRRDSGNERAYVDQAAFGACRCPR